MSKLAQLVSTSESNAAFQVRYNILEDVEIRPCEEGDVA